MSLLSLSLLVFLMALVAGIVGVLTGLGGGVVVTPFLVLVFGFDIRYAMGASLVAVLTTSLAGARRFAETGLMNLRIGLFLEIGAVVGAIGGAFLVTVVPGMIISIIFGSVLLISSAVSFLNPNDASQEGPSDRLAGRLGMEGTRLDRFGKMHEYRVYNLLAGSGLLAVAGLLSGLLGIGSGAVKVIAMDRVMRLPYKISTSTSNFMIGITAAASAGIYFGRGYIDPGLAVPVMLGVVVGASLGASFFVRVKSASLRIVFGVVILLLGADMIYTSLAGVAR